MKAYKYYIVKIAIVAIYPFCRDALTINQYYRISNAAGTTQVPLTRAAITIAQIPCFLRGLTSKSVQRDHLKYE